MLQWHVFQVLENWARPRKVQVDNQRGAANGGSRKLEEAREIVRAREPEFQMPDGQSSLRPGYDRLKAANRLRRLTQLDLSI